MLFLNEPLSPTKMSNQKPKQIKCYCGHTTMCDCGEQPKQETLEDELWGNVFAKIKQYGLNNEVLTILKQNFNISKR